MKTNQHQNYIKFFISFLNFWLFYCFFTSIWGKLIPFKKASYLKIHIFIHRVSWISDLQRIYKFLPKPSTPHTWRLLTFPAKDRSLRRQSGWAEGQIPPPADGPEGAGRGWEVTIWVTRPSSQLAHVSVPCQYAVSKEVKLQLVPSGCSRVSLFSC